MSAMLRLPWQRPLPSNGSLYIQQLWASGGRTREPILMKFGTQQQIRTTIILYYARWQHKNKKKKQSSKNEKYTQLQKKN